MKTIEISKTELNNFIERNKSIATYFQSSQYIDFESSNKFKNTILGFYKDSSLIAICSIFYKKVFFKYLIGKSPRGIVTISNTVEIYNDIISSLKQYLIDNHYMNFKIDPNIIIFKRNRKGKVIYKLDDAKDILKCFKSHNFKHHGFNMNFENSNPRFEAELDINEENKILFKNLRKNIRNKLKKATKYGLVIYKDSKNDIKRLYPLLKSHLNLPLSYYLKINNSFRNNIEIYYAKLNTFEYVENSRILYEKEEEINNYLTNIIQNNGYKGKNLTLILNKKMQSDKNLNSYKNYMITATNLLKNHPNGLIVGVSIILKYKNKIYLLAESYNHKYHNLCSNFLIKWKIIEKYAKDNEINTFNLGGISGNLKDNHIYYGLNEMKLGYNSTITEYIGEFSITPYPRAYSIYLKFGIKEK